MGADPPSGGPTRSMGHQPGLDGLRAISVMAVIAYHAGAPWMTGGFFGVEVFFVVSGYLITTLLLQERERSGRVDLRQFWLRRARRLLPALGVMLLTVAGWVAAFGSAEQRSTLRRDLPWSLAYANNWGQIIGSTPYFAPTDPPVLRHLWSLAVEEQWYLLWPLVFVLAVRIGGRRTAATGGAIVAIAGGVMIVTAFLHGHVSDNGLYLSTPTRSSGLLLGAGAAFVWRPWRHVGAPTAAGRIVEGLVGVVTDLFGLVALCGLIVVMVVGRITSPSTYQWMLALVSTLSIVAVAATVAPGATTLRRLLGHRWLVAVGERSYGLYLWHWSALVLFGATDASIVRVVSALTIAAALNELTFRYVEGPVRRNGFRAALIGHSTNRRRAGVAAGVAGVAVTAAMAVVYAFTPPYDPAVGGETVEFDAASLGEAVEGSAESLTTLATLTTEPSGGTSPTPTTVASTDAMAVPATPTTSTIATTSTAATTSTTLAELPRRLVVVGDSQAHSFVVNLPAETDRYFEVTDGAVDGCGVHDEGTVKSALSGFRRDFGDCKGWHERWVEAARRGDSDLALVMLGAWDVFDLEIDGATVAFESPAGEELLVAHLQVGLDALEAAGVHVALLEVPCMRPVENSGARVPPLPERGDDERVGRLNELLRKVAAASENVTFVEGPDEWCDGSAISTDVAYRWDGVHVYQAGANLILGGIALPLLQIPLPTDPG